MSLHWLDVVMLMGYFGGMAGMAAWFSRKNTSTEEYFVGGRGFPGWAIGLSMVGTSISSVTSDVLPTGLRVPFDLYYTGFIGNVVMFTVGFGASFLFGSVRRSLRGLTVWYSEGM